ncbi:hypothetical protein OPQ81_011166 [Rhizoctonia solani]|nr:hypothetical protein OPQ81_011166 [Rhizoctonia solani]
MSPNGKTLIFKVHLIVQGHQQEPSVSFDQTTSNTPALKMFCIFCTLTAHNDFDMHMINITGAYTHADIDHPIYIKFPEGFSKGSSHVMLLKKALYSTHQSGYLWEKYHNDKLFTIGYATNPADVSAFTCKLNGVTSLLLVYVNDILILTTKGKIDPVKAKLMKLFNCKDLGKAKSFIGMKIT